MACANRPDRQERIEKGTERSKGKRERKCTDIAISSMNTYTYTVVNGNCGITSKNNAHINIPLYHYTIP